jgi:hypothetical protein
MLAPLHRCTPLHGPLHRMPCNINAVARCIDSPPRVRVRMCAHTRLRDMRATTEQWNRAVSIGAQIQAEERLKPSPVRSETNLRDGTPGTPVDRGRRGQRHRHNRMATPGVCGAPVRQARLVA